MKLLRSFPVLAFTLVLLSIVGVSIATQSVALLLVGGVLAALSRYVTEGPRGRSLPNWTANILIIAVTLNVVVDLFGHRADVMSVLARFIVWLTLIKLYQQKSPRDYAQLLGLSLLLMLIGCLESNGLLFAVTLLVYTLLGLYVLLLFQLHAAFERGRRSRRAAVPTGYRILPSMQPHAGRRPGLQLRALMAAVAVTGLVAGSAFFVLFPRDVGAGVIQMRGAGNRSGYTDVVNLTSGTRITSSRRVVMTVRVSGAGVPRSRPLRLRGTSLDRYDGRGRWHQSTLHRQRRFETRPPLVHALCPLPAAGTITQEVELLMPGHTVFGLATPVAISTPRPRRIRFDPRHLSIQDEDAGPLQRYTMVSDPDPTESMLRALIGAAGETDGRPVVDQFRNFDPRVEHMARTLLRDAGLAATPPADAEERYAWNATAAGVIERHLRVGDYRYDTDLRDVHLTAPGGGPVEPIAQFLFETRRGHCEYFASAMAALCNTVGIPARLVTGFVALEFDDREGVYIVRESNAHAWTEVQTSPWRWTAYDPTPPGTLREIHAGRHTRTDRWRWLFDRLEARWSNNFVAYDRDVQERLIRSLEGGRSGRLREVLDAIREWAVSVNRAFYLGPAGYIWMGTVALAIVIAGIAIWTRLRRRARLRRTLNLEHAATPARTMWQLGFYMDMLDALRRAGRPKPSWQPPLQFAAALDRRGDPAASLVRRITDLFYQARYGGRLLTRDEVAHARALVHELSEQG